MTNKGKLSGLQQIENTDKWVTITKSEYDLLHALAVKQVMLFNEEQEKEKPKKRGAPKKEQFQNIDCERAFNLWQLANNIYRAKELKRLKGWPTNRQLIDLAQTLSAEVEDFKILFPNNVAGNAQTLEPSVSRGKKELEIDELWNSDVCELIRDI